MKELPAHIRKYQAQRVYLAAPYTAESSRLVDHRHSLVIQKVAQLSKSGIIAYSPIAHYHHVQREHLPHESQSFWMSLCYAELERSDALFIYQLEGWKTSHGVRKEVNLAIELQKPIVPIPEYTI